MNASEAIDATVRDDANITVCADEPRTGWSATEAIEAANRHGIQLTLNGSDLVVKAPTKPPDAVLDAIKQRKPEIIAMLSSVLDAFGFLIGQFERELAALKAANAATYAIPQPWKVK
jgi:TubC N-terminal docking domain